VENNSFFSFVPFAAEVPSESWIVPKRHKADFGSITENEKDDFAQILNDILGRLYERLNDPDYNYILYTAPKFEAGAPHLHWYLRIKPRLTTKSGFEIGTGISINRSVPEEDARFLTE